MAEATVKSSVVPKVVVATTVALTFISFWRGTAIVLSDLASSMFYAGGIAEKAMGQSAAWFVLGVMIFSFAVRSIYMEGCSMFVRGGVYVVVRDSMGRCAAKLSISALVFDYLLTGPISSVSAGHYIGRLVNEVSEMFHLPFHCPPNLFAVLFALGVIIYFWWSNIIGIHESSGKALRIMQITTVMVAILLLWCPLTLLLHGNVELPPAPTLENLNFQPEALGWLEGTFWPQLAGVALIIAFGHAFLAMSGFETLAQVYREIAFPKLRNLRITGNLVCLYALLSTGLITFFAAMIIPDDIRANYTDNLIGGLAMNLAGPTSLRLIFHAFVVLVGALILSGAVNTAIIGANSVLNRVAEDGVLLSWFRKPHRTYGTTYRIISSIALLQLITILLSRGDVYLLGEAYAFGVVWSFFLKSLGVIVLRYQRKDQEYRTPLNFRIAGIEVPFGLIVTSAVLFLVALANLFTKQVATISGLSFTFVLFLLFTISEHINLKKHSRSSGALEEFNLDHQEEVDDKSINVKPGCTLVAVRDYNKMAHLQWVFDTSNLRQKNVVVMTVRPLSAGEGEYELDREQYFAHYERDLFSHVVQMAEKAGRHVELLVVPAINPLDAIVQTAARLKAAFLVTGSSPRMSIEELARRLGLSWEQLPEPHHPFSLAIVSKDRKPHYVALGPHVPRLWPEDVERVHDIWLELSDKEGFGARIHHRDIMGVALRRMERDLEGERRRDVLRDLQKELK